MKRLIMIFILWFFLILFFNVFASPSFDQVVWWKEINIGLWWAKVKKIKGDVLYDPKSMWIDKNDTFFNNILNIFFPQSLGNGWKLWSLLRVIAVALWIIFLIRWGALFIFSAENESELSKAKMNLIYMFYWFFLFFGATLILGDRLFIWNPWEWVWWVLQRVQNNIFFNILSFLKAFAYFVAILMIVYYWFQIFRAVEKEDKIKAARTGVINVIIALIFIRLIDFIYYVAQRENFKDSVIDILNRFTKLGLYLIGFIWLWMFFYAGFLLFTSRGEEDAWKKAKNIFINIFLVIVVIILFLLIIKQLVNAF